MNLILRGIRRASHTLWIQLVGTALLSAAFGAFVYITAPSLELWWQSSSALVLGALFALALLLLVAQQRFDAVELLGAAACIACAMYARAALIPYKSGDYTQYLLPWANQLGSLSIKEALNTPIGNYNLPYIYFLTIISHLNVEILIHIKAFSCLFDIILAWGVMRLVSTEVEDRRIQLGVYILVLLSPSFMIDSSMWSQCDSVYVAFCVLAAFAAVKGRGRMCAICWTVAFCFKLQAVFVLPALAVALFMGKVKPKHLLWIPVVYFISLIPAFLAGRSLADCVGIYVNQIDSYNLLFVNAPSVWRLFGDAQISELTNMSTYLALGSLLLFTLFALSVTGKMTDRKLIALFFLSSLLVPYLLPRMHDRYFYMAEVFAIVYFAIDRRKWYIPAIICAANLSSYMEYFLIYSMSSYEEYAAKTVGISPVYFSIAFLVILAIEGRDFFSGLIKETPDTVV